MSTNPSSAWGPPLRTSPAASGTSGTWRCRGRGRCRRQCRLRHCRRCYCGGYCGIRPALRGGEGLHPSGCLIKEGNEGVGRFAPPLLFSIFCRARRAPFSILGRFHPLPRTGWKDVSGRVSFGVDCEKATVDNIERKKKERDLLYAWYYA